MSPDLAKQLDHERTLRVLIHLLKHPSPEMIEAGKTAIRESCVVEYLSITAPSYVLAAMAEVALKQAGA